MNTVDFLIINDLAEEAIRVEYLAGTGVEKITDLDTETKDGFYRDIGFFSIILKKVQPAFKQLKNELENTKRKEAPNERHT